MNEPVRESILKTVTDSGMIDYGDRIVVGVSGGADSLCLLHFLTTIQEEFSLEIIVAHVNHNLRGKEAERDQRVVEEFCRERQIRCEVKSVEVGRLATENGESSEECGRRIRYEFFDELSHDNGKIATAHTLSDSVETVLFHLVRGTSLNGLVGIPEKRGNIIRPLIRITRSQVEEYCRENHIAYVTDSTNLQNQYNRNKIRNIVTPVFKEINPSFEVTVGRLCESAKYYLDFVTETAVQVINKSRIKQNTITMYRCADLQQCHQTVLRQVILLLFQQAGCYAYEEKHILLTEKAVQQNGGAVDLPKNYCAVVRQGNLRVYRKVQPNEILIPFPKNDAEFRINQQKITVKFLTKEEFDKNISVHKLLLKNALDCDIIHSEIFIRTRKTADRFLQKNRGVEKSVKRLFNEAKIPSEQRNNVLLVAQDSEVLWIDGFGVSERACVKPTTRKVALITVRSVQSGG